MSHRTPYERLRELHATLTEQSTATVDGEDREAVAAALRVAEAARHDFKTPETQEALAALFGMPTPQQWSTIPSYPEVVEHWPARPNALRRGWDATRNNWPLALAVGFIAAFILVAILAFARLS